MSRTELGYHDAVRRLIIIADDFAGAADCAAAFAARGARTYAVLDARLFELGDWEIMALDADTRDAPPSVAEERVRRLMRCAASEHTVFKKVDSTLRGNLAVELRATLACRPADCVIAAPAFPATGRTTMGGRQLVHGCPLEESEFADQTSTSSIGELLAPAGLSVTEVGLRAVRAGGVAQLAREARAELLVCDAETEDDLERIVRGGLDSGTDVMWLGSAGLARRLAQRLAIGSRTASELIDAIPVLLVVGSPASATRAQLEQLRATGDVHEIVIGGEAEGDRAESLRECLRAGRDCALTLKSGTGARDHGREGTSRLGSIAAAAAELAGGLVLTGGETARAVLEAMSVRGLELECEVQPGIPLGFTDNSRRLPVAVKAGGFGDESALLACRRAMRGPRSGERRKDPR